MDKTKSYAEGNVYINRIEGLWSYSKQRLLQYHGLSRHHFPLYLKELEFRYNYRKSDFYKSLLHALSHGI